MTVPVEPTGKFKSDRERPVKEIYLNWGTLAKTWPTVLQQMQKYENEYELNPTLALFNTWGRVWQVQTEVADFFHARPQDLFFRNNVTVAMNDFLMGVQIPPGDLATTDLEYGAVDNILRLRAKKDGRRVHQVQLPIGEELKSQQQLLDLIMNQLPSSTRLLLISHVMTGSGLKVPIRELARLTRARGILLAVDGAHGPGATDLDFSELEDVDFYGGNLHKWMRGPKGTGFGWSPKRNHELIQPITACWTTFETPERFVGFADQEAWCGAMLMSYCLNWAAFYALSDVIKIWKSQGQKNILQEIQLRRSFVQEQAREILGFKLLSPSVPELQSPLVTFELPKSHVQKNYQIIHELQEQKSVTVSITPLKSTFALRFTVHAETTESDITEGLKRVKAYFNS